jgi:ribulose-5-phosphate 4-epimerase/fuculose-1-phosphate aldolase
MTQETEGVIKFSLEFTDANVIQPAWILQFNAWRHIHHRLQLIGQMSDRYQGYGFGNISMRQPGEPENFIITGTQTSGRVFLTPDDFALVTYCDPSHNKIIASGKTKPSSEAMTHGQLYQLNQEIHCIVHAHCPEIWTNRDTLEIPTTRPDVPYGTPLMALEVERLFEQTDVKRKRIFAMAGHEDGIVGFGRNFFEASIVLIDYLVKAIECNQSTNRR